MALFTCMNTPGTAGPSSGRMRAAHGPRALPVATTTCDENERVVLNNSSVMQIGRCAAPKRTAARCQIIMSTDAARHL